MAMITPPFFLQGGSHDAKAMRQALAAMAGVPVGTFVGGVGAVGPGHGLARPGALAVTQTATPSLAVLVGVGSGFITGTSSLAQGVYAFTNDAPETLPIATPDATHPRRDLVVVQVRENFQDGGGVDEIRLFIVAGAPAAVPVDPAIPPSCLVLRRVAVAAGAPSIIDANITMPPGLASASTWNQAWGVVPGGYVERTSTTGSVGTTVTDIPTLTVTFTAIAGRRYEITGQALAVKSTGTAGDTLNLYIRDGAGVQLALNQHTSHAATTTATLPIGVTVTPAAGATTYKLSHNNSAGTGVISASATNRAWMSVKDVGPA